MVVCMSVFIIIVAIVLLQKKNTSPLMVSSDLGFSIGIGKIYIFMFAFYEKIICTQHVIVNDINFIIGKYMEESLNRIVFQLILSQSKNLHLLALEVIMPI
jgi:hypothetical protein